jgi:ZIP family zinc transporter
MFNGFLGGIVIFLLLDRIISHLHISGLGNDRKKSELQITKVKKIGLLMAIGIAMHNFPEGLAIGGGYSGRAEFGIGLAILIALHNIPEGLAIATPLYAGDASKISTLIQCALTGLPMIIGALIGFLIGELSTQAVSICLGFAGGAMFFITCDELIPECHMEVERYGHIPILSIVIGFVVGLLIG